MSLTRSVAHNSFLLLVGKVVGLFVGALTFKLLAVALGEARLGDYGAVLGFLAILVSCADCGLTTICARELAREGAEGERTFADALGLRLVLGPLLMPAAVALAFLWYRRPDDAALRMGVVAAACVVPVQLLTLSLLPVFQVRQKMAYVVLADLVSRGAQLGTIVALIRFGLLGYTSALVIAWLGMGLNLLICLWAARRLIRVRVLFELARWRELFRTALPLGLSAIVSSIYLRFGFLLLRSWDTEETTGLYYVAFRAYDYALFIPSAFITVAFPVLVGHLAGDQKRARAGLQRSFDFLLLMGVPLAVGVGVLAPQVVRFLSGPAYVAAQGPLRLLYVAAIFSYLTSLFAYVLVALDRQKDALAVNTVVLAANVALCLWAIPRWGMLGAAWCMLATEVLSFACTSAFVRHRYGFLPELRRLPRVLLAAGVMGAALWWLARYDLRLWALAPIGMAIYGGLAMALRVVDRQTLTQIVRLRRPVSGPTEEAGQPAAVGSRR